MVKKLFISYIIIFSIVLLTISSIADTTPAGHTNTGASASEHRMSDTLLGISDQNNHYFTCNAAGCDYVYVEAHLFSNNTCVKCGYVRPGTTPVSFSTPTPTVLLSIGIHP